MSCDCCLAPNGHNIILEVVTLVFAAFFFLAGIFFGGTVFSIACHVALIICCAFGIAALKNQQNYRLGWVSVVIAIIVCVTYIILMIIFFIALPAFIEVINTQLNNTSESDRQAVSAAKGLVIFSLILAFAYIAFGIGTSMALAIKHRRICSALRQNDTSNQVVTGTSTVIHYGPPDQQLQPSPYYAGMNPQQPQPPSYSEKNRADMA